MNFRTDTTKGGYKILSIHGPDGLRTFSGVVQHNDEYVAVNWDGRGQDVDFDGEYDLIPLDEPKHDSTAVTDKLQYALDTCMDKLHDLDQRLALEMKRNDELHKDAVARVNGLRADYLADKDAVSPARVDDLEERVEDAHETAAFANQKVVAWTDRVEALEERLDKLECDTQKLEYLRGEDRREVIGELEAVETQLNKNDSKFVELDHLTKETDRYLNIVGDLAQHAHLQIVKLNKRLEALEQRTQPSEKGVWVTRKMLEAAWKDAYKEDLPGHFYTNEVTRRILLDGVCERLGLEE